MERQATGIRVRQARMRRGWSKEHAAREAGISSITWKRIEDGLPVQDVKLESALNALFGDVEPSPEPDYGAINDQVQVVLERRKRELPEAALAIEDLQRLVAEAAQALQQAERALTAYARAADSGDPEDPIRNDG